MVCGDIVVAGVFSRATKPAETVKEPVEELVKEPEKQSEEKKRRNKKNAD